MVRPRIPASGFTTYKLDEIRKALQAFGYDEGKIAETVERVRKERALLKGQNLKRIRAIAAWRYLRTPLNHEYKVIKLALSYIERKELRGDTLDDTDMARRDAYEAYKAVVEKLILDFAVLVEKNPNGTPLQALRDEQETGKLKYVRGIEHWSDWVPEKVKDRVTQMFADIPYRKQAKVKLPFEQVVPKSIARTKRRAMEDAMAKELATLQSTYAKLGHTVWNCFATFFLCTYHFMTVPARIVSFRHTLLTNVLIYATTSNPAFLTFRC